MSSRADVIAVVEAAYGLDQSERGWLEAVSRSLAPHFFEDLGGIASFFDRHATDPTKIVSSVSNFGTDPELLASLRMAFEAGGTDERDRSLRQGGPLLRLSALAGTPLLENPFYGPLAKRIGFSDLVVLRAMNPDGTGAFFATPVRVIARSRSA